MRRIFFVTALFAFQAQAIESICVEGMGYAYGSKEYIECSDAMTAKPKNYHEFVCKSRALEGDEYTDCIKSQRAYGKLRKPYVDAYIKDSSKKSDEKLLDEAKTALAETIERETQPGFQYPDTVAERAKSSCDLFATKGYDKQMYGSYKNCYNKLLVGIAEHRSKMAEIRRHAEKAKEYREEAEYLGRIQSYSRPQINCNTMHMGKMSHTTCQ